MTRPSIIRADTLDLQDPAAPSAQDHPNHSHISDTPPSVSASSIAPHQAETLREVAHETAEAEAQNPTVSWSNGSANDSDQKTRESHTAMYHQKQQDDLAIAQNGGVSSADEDDMDGESGSDMDDDLMDKISSSPSIEDVYHDKKDDWMLLSGGASPLPNQTFNRDDNQLNLTANVDGFTGALVQKGNKSTMAIVSAMVMVTRGIYIQRWSVSSHLVRTSIPSPTVLLSWIKLRHGSPTNFIVKTNFGTTMATCCFTAKALVIPLPAHGNGVIDQLPQSIDSFHYDDTLDEVDTCSDDECLLRPEDIDFEFVYALHTFVATVEGQANATKGDTMVLLDDSNSYWWLVRVVKDSSIGYLPAEHIETPTERLARLNKHRNIDLSATMLGDQAQKQKNSFKSIRRRRKTVAFAEPTYVDYSDFDYSTDDEDIDELFGSQPNAQQQREQRQQQQREQQNAVDDGITDDLATVEPLKTRTVGENKTGATQSLTELQMEDGLRSSEESLDDRNDGLNRSRNGVVRNTDSFFKDDSVETKKITLTPNLLRDDNTPRQSSDSTTKDGRSTSSMDKMDRELISDKEKKKLKDKDKKDKEKKTGGLRGFFSRKDRKKAGEDDDESFGKRSMDMASESRNSDDRSLEEHQQLSPDRTRSQRQTSKLQKAAPPSSMSKTPAGNGQKPVELSSYLAEGRNNDVSNVPPVSMRIVGPETNETQHVPSNQGQQQGPDSTLTSAPKEERSGILKLAPSLNNSVGAVVMPEKSGKAKLDTLSDMSEEPEAAVEARAVAEDGVKKEEEEEEEEEENASSHGPSAQNVKASQSIKSPTMEKTQLPATTTPAQEAQQSPRQGDFEKIGPSSPSNASNPPALMVDTSSVDDITSEGSPSPELVVQTENDVVRGGSSSSNGKEAAVWDDSKLRAFFDESDHIRDLLVVVYDKTNVEPAGNDHPVVGGLFREQNAKLAEITTQLDNMLGDWLARKQRLRGAI
ncbi:hypothetical protein E4U55_006694 [Claviceps digitariae]|nr:hypothetical protein E4U55_006694 [Claviceps digitariae]